MENTLPSGNNTPISNIIIVGEATDQSKHEDIENRNQVTGDSNNEGFQEQEDNQPQQSKEIQKISYWNGLYALVILGSCVASTSTVTMIPIHNIFEQPELWWEWVFIATVPLLLLGTFPLSRCVYLVFGPEFFNSKCDPLLYFTVFYLGWIIPSFFIYIFWTAQIGNNFPMPCYSAYCGVIHYFIRCLVIWFGFPGELRNQDAFRTRLKPFMYYLAIESTIKYQLILIDIVFRELKRYEYENGIQIQWIAAFVIPIFRRFYEWVLPKPFNRAAGPDNDAATFYLETHIGSTYVIYVTVRLVHADAYMAYWILGVEFCINLCYALRIVLMHNKVQGNMTTEEITESKNNKHAILRNLVSMESIEVLIPLAYAISYATAYYGPNAGIMRMVKSSYFGYKEEDIQVVLESVFKMAAFDACGAILIGVLLLLICQINIFDEFCGLMKKHWITISIITAALMTSVRNVI